MLSIESITLNVLLSYVPDYRWLKRESASDASCHLLGDDNTGDEQTLLSADELEHQPLQMEDMAEFQVIKQKEGEDLMDNIEL